MVRKLLTLNHLEFGQDALTERTILIFCEMLTTLSQFKVHWKCKKKGKLKGDKNSILLPVW